MSTDDFRAANLANWEDRVPIHLAGDIYKIDAIADEPDTISQVVQYDRQAVGDVAGKSLLHAQCHIGTDTLSWAKLGARVTGIDFSPRALGAARRMAARMRVDATFVEAELYNSPQLLSETYDIVYTGVGALCWLNDVDRWARVMAHFTAPGGRFYVRDGHPMLSSLDDERTDGKLVVAHDYFETAQPLRWEEATTYGGEGKVEHTVTYEWNHGLGEIVTALIRAGFRIDQVGEHRTIEWQALPHMVAVDDRWALPEHQRDTVPLAFSVLATRTG